MPQQNHGLTGAWALILGASSGFGAAVALELARRGMHIAGVHLDRKATLPNVERIVRTIKDAGREALFFNANAADDAKRQEIVETLRQRLAPDTGVRVLLHSLAFGTLKPLIAPSAAEAINKPQMDMTLDVMANSLVYWTQDLHRAGLLRRHSRIFAMTSAGGQRVWKTYGAVSAAKAALESHCRQLALELAHEGITVNAIRAGVTDTPALRKIPGHEDMIQWASQKNPGGRLTTTEDVAGAVAVLALAETGWMTGNVLGVDGGEFIVD